VPPQQKLIAAIGLTKQSAKGAIAAAATFGFGVESGKVLDLPIAQDLRPLTLFGAASDRFAPGADRTAVTPGAVFSSPAWAKSIGLLLFGALGTDTPSGGGPYLHTITPAQDLPYLTLFTVYGGGGERERLGDCKVDQLVIGWDEVNPLKVDTTLRGLVPGFGVGNWVPATNDETTQTWFGPSGGTFQLDVQGAALAAAQVNAASITIANNLKPVKLSKSIIPDDVFPGQQAVFGTIRIVPNDFTDWRKAVGGTGAAAAMSEVPIFGKFDLKVLIDANTFIQFQADRCSMLIDYPDADTGGGYGEMTVAFMVARKTDGSAAFTALVKNTIASY
jgi:tail tube protein